MDGTILVADDDRTIRTVLTQALTRAGCKVHATSSLLTLMRWVEEGRGDLVISDVMMPDGNGLESLPDIQAQRPDLPVIIISAQNNILTAIQANEADAFDYLPKPFDLPDLMKRASKALNLRQKKTTADADAESGATRQDLPLIGATPAMQALYKLIARIMNTNMSVMVTGGSGSGKSLVARTIHEFSDRRMGGLVVLGASDLQSLDDLRRATSRLSNGTLVLEDVAALGSEQQTILVQYLDGLAEGELRIISTAPSDVAAHLGQAGLREDLYFRLAGVTLNVPDLRDRIDDLDLLVRYFLGKSSNDTEMAQQFSPGAIRLARQYSWPGNVRQLENVAQRLAATSETAEVSEAELKQALENQPAAATMSSETPSDRLGTSVELHLRRYFDMMGGNLPPPGLYGRILREVEAPLIEIALDATGGNQAKCADLLGINRNTLRKKITELDIRVTRRRKLM